MIETMRVTSDVPATVVRILVTHLGPDFLALIHEALPRCRDANPSRSELPREEFACRASLTSVTRRSASS